MRQAVHVYAAGDTLPDWVLPAREGQGQGQGQGVACLVGWDCLDGLPVSVALASRFQPVGPLLQAVQGQRDLAMAKRQARKLVATMQRNGSEPSNATEGDAIGDGVLAVLRWRQTFGPVHINDTATLVCWRAVVASIARRDLLGESLDTIAAGDGDGGGVDYDTLTASALPLPQLCGDASREDKAARLLFERARAKRAALLARRFEALAVGATGRRRQAIERIHRAAVLLLHGETLDNAAAAVGYHAAGQGRGFHRAGDWLVRAARRLGLRFTFNLRMRDGGDGDGGRRGPFVPMSTATATALDFKPSANLPKAFPYGLVLARRNGHKDSQAAKRQARQAARVNALAAKRQAWAFKLARLQGKRQAAGRQAVRAFKAAGVLRDCGRDWAHDWQAIQFHYASGRMVHNRPDWQA
jgi:hypothetical protein